MSWRGLADRLAAVRSRLRRPLPQAPLPELAAASALDIYGPEEVVRRPLHINVCALAISLDRLVVHELSMDAVRAIAATDLHVEPAEPPRMLRGPWIVEVRHPGAEALFGATCSIAGYEHEGTRYIVGLDHPDGATLARWRPLWRGGELDAAVVAETEQAFLDGVDAGEHAAWGREAARFALVLGMLLDADGTPLETAAEGPRLAGSRKGKPHPARPWAVRRVFLGEAQRARHASAGGAGDGATPPGREVAEVAVRGHLKRQPYGPGGTLRRLVYVAGYEARRWVAPKPLRVVVGVR